MHVPILNGLLFVWSVFVDSIILWLRYISFVDDDSIPLSMDDDAVPFSDAPFIYEYQESSRYLQYYAELHALR